MESARWYLGLILTVGFVFFMGARDLSKDVSPAHTVCANIAKSGATCVVDKATLQAQVLKVQDALLRQSVFLVISDGKEVIDVIQVR